VKTLRLGRWVSACLLLLTVIATQVPAEAATSVTLRVSVNRSGGNANSSSSWPSVSSNGRFIAFASYASNLVANDTNSTSDVFVRDVLAGTTKRVSVASNGAQANGPSFTPAISANGNVVAFQSYATNLVPGDTEGHADVFVHHLSTGVTRRVSVTAQGKGANDDSSEPAISGDGSVVAFSSVATNLVPQPVNATGLCCDIFVRNLLTGRTTLADPMLDGVGSGDSFSPTLSYTGRYVAFGSWGCSLVNVPCQDQSNIFRWDVSARKMTLITRSITGGVATGCGANPAISSDGSMVAFTSDGGDLVPNDTNSAPDVFIRNLLTGQTKRVSVTSKGAQTNGGLGRVTMSSNARMIAFQSDAWNMVPGDSNLVSDIFVHDMQTNKTTRVSLASNGAQGNGPSINGAISGDGTLVAFESDADNLVQSDTNQTTDVFAHRLA
jgi:Tol biopolymer transport system component